MDPGLVSFSFWSPFVSSFTRQGRDFFPWHLIPHARVASYTAFPSTSSGIPHPLFIRYDWYRICTFEHHSRWILRSFSFVHIISPFSPPLVHCRLQPFLSLFFLSIIFLTYLSLHYIFLSWPFLLLEFLVSFPPHLGVLAWIQSAIYSCNIPPPLAVVPCSYTLLHTYTLDLLKTLHWDLTSCLP